MSQWFKFSNSQYRCDACSRYFYFVMTTTDMWSNVGTKYLFPMIQIFENSITLWGFYHSDSRFNLIIWGLCPLSIRVPADFLVILSRAVRLLFCLHISLEISIFLSIVSFYWKLLSKYFVLYILWFLHPTWSHYSSLTITL